MDQHAAVAKVAIDATAAMGVVTMPLWLQFVVVWGQPILIFGGFVVLGMRFVVALRDMRERR